MQEPRIAAYWATVLSILTPPAEKREIMASIGLRGRHEPDIRAGEAFDDFGKASFFYKCSCLLCLEPFSTLVPFSGQSSSCRSTRNRKTHTSQSIAFLVSRFS